MSNFTPDFFRSNRERLKTLFLGSAPIILTAHGLLQRNSDMAYPFRQDSNFWYLTGINEPDIVLVIDKDKEYLIVPPRNEIRSVFDGTIDYSNLSQRSGIKQVLDNKTGWKQLESRLKRVKHVATLAAPPARVETFEFYTNPARANLITKIKQVNNGVELLDLREHFVKMRMVKQKPELETLKRSIQLTTKTLAKFQKRIANFDHEHEVEAMITHEFRKSGAHHGYPPIVASGKNACILHYEANNAALNKHELLLIDTGAETEQYSADITRTYAIGEATKRQRNILSAVVEVQDYALSLLKPGAVIKENEKLIEQFMGEKLRELGLIKTIESKEVRKYYPHATSHSLGLDVHDIADYERPITEGMVFTVEPGIYISAEDIGVRIEDNVLITKSGIEVLSKSLPR